MALVVLHTDPLCPWSWGAEPVVRRLEVEFSDQVRFTYVMAGMSDEIDPGPKIASTLEMVAETGMAADPRVWLGSPPRSSHPACIAVKAAAAQGVEAGMLRRLREGAMLRRERLDRPEALRAAARDVDGLEVARFDADTSSGTAARAFAADRKRAEAACGDRRPALPGFVVDDGEVVGAGAVRDAVLATGARPGPLPAPEQALRRFGLMTTAELAEVCGLSAVRARTELWELAAASRARPELHVCGETWRPA